MPSRLLQRYYRPPLVGLLAFAIALAANPIAHAAVVAMRDAAGPDQAFIVYQVLGLAALLALIWGIKKNEEVSGTLIGFVTGVVIWTCWASYAFKFNMVSFDMPRMQIAEDGYSRPANLFFVQGSIGICVATLLFFILNKDTKCNAFRWIQRRLRLNLGAPAPGQGRNFCRITFLETIYVIWFCYSASLFLGDERFLGYHHPVTYLIFGGCAVWGTYLIWRLMKFTRVMAALRYAIPTKAIVWLVFGELAIKYGWYDEFWLKPSEYPLRMWVLVFIFVVLLVASGFLPQRKQVPDPVSNMSTKGIKGES